MGFDPSQCMKASANEKRMGPSVKIANPRKFGAMNEYATRAFRHCAGRLEGVAARDEPYDVSATLDIWPPFRWRLPLSTCGGEFFAR
jgi:hypothetical protein